MPDVSTPTMDPNLLEVLERGVDSLKAEIEVLSQTRADLLLPDRKTEILAEISDLQEKLQTLRFEAQTVTSSAEVEASQIINAAHAKAEEVLAAAREGAEDTSRDVEKARRVWEQERNEQLGQIETMRSAATDYATEQRALAAQAKQEVLDWKNALEELQTAERESMAARQREIEEAAAALEDDRQALAFEQAELDDARRVLQQDRMAHDSAVKAHENHVVTTKGDIEQRLQAVTVLEARCAEAASANQITAEGLGNQQAAVQALETSLKALETQLRHDEASLEPRLQAVVKREADLRHNWEVYGAHKQALDAANRGIEARALRSEPLPEAPEDIVEPDGPNQADHGEPV